MLKQLVFLIGIILFSCYFYMVGAGYFSLLPFFVFFVVGVMLLYEKRQYFSISNMSNNYIFLASWILVNIALGFLLVVLGINIIEMLLGLLALNIISILVSYITRLPYSTEIAYITYFLVSLAIIGYAVYDPSLPILQTVQYVLIAAVGVLSFITFVVPIYYEVPKYVKTHRMIVIFLLIILTVYAKIHSPYYAIITDYLLIGVIVGSILYISTLLPEIQETNKGISIRKILAGERILPHLQKQQNKNKVQKFLQEFIKHIPQYVEQIIEGVVILLFIIFIYHMIYHISLEHFVVQREWSIVVLLFLSILFLLKKIGYTSVGQRVGTFLGINILVAMGLFAWFPPEGGEVSSSLIVAMLGWNMMYAIMIGNIHIVFSQFLREKVDYIVAIGVDMIMSLVNMWLMTYLGISGQLIFAYIFLYITIKVMAILYLMNIMKEYEEKKYKKTISLQKNNIEEGNDL